MTRRIVFALLLLAFGIVVRNVLNSDVDFARRDLELQMRTRVTVKTWSRGQDAVVSATLLVENTNEIAVRDVVVSCYPRDAGGTNLGSATYRLGEPLEAKAGRTIEGVALGAVDQATTQVVCMVTDLKW